MSNSLFKFLKAPTPPVPPAAAAPAANAPASPPAGESAADDPLEGLRQLWQTPATPSGNPGAPAPLFAVDQGKLAEAVKGTNFAAGIPKETLEKALAGDATALAAAINAASQNAFHAAVLAVPGMVEPAVKTATQAVRAEVPSLFRNLQLQNTRSENSVLNDPAISPVVEALKSQAAAHNPTATPQEIMALVEQQMGAFGAALAPQPAPGTAGSNVPAQEDYSWLNS
jgi:hypothetical protein